MRNMWCSQLVDVRYCKDQACVIGCKPIKLSWLTGLLPRIESFPSCHVHVHRSVPRLSDLARYAVLQLRRNDETGLDRDATEIEDLQVLCARCVLDVLSVTGHQPPKLEDFNFATDSDYTRMARHDVKALLLLGRIASLVIGLMRVVEWRLAYVHVIRLLKGEAQYRRLCISGCIYLQRSDSEVLMIMIKRSSFAIRIIGIAINCGVCCIATKRTCCNCTMIK